MNYVFQIVVGNMVSVEEFGMYNSINSLAVNVSIVFSPLSVMACQITASNQSKIEKNRGVYIQIFGVTIGLFVCVLMGGVLLFRLIQGKFGITNMAQWIVILIMIGASGLYAILISVLQGMECFVWYGIIGALLVLGKLGICVINVKQGMAVHGIVWAMLLSYLCMIIVMVLFLKKRLWKGAEGQREYLSKKEIIQLYGTTFLVQILVSFYINGGEIILMDYLFDDTQVGLYSSAVTLGKVCLYIISIVSVVLLPKVANKATQGVDTRGILYKTVGISLVLAIVYAIFLLVGGKQIIPMVFGQEYNAAMEYMNSVMFFAIPLSTLSIVHNYFLGIGKIKAYGVMLGIITCVAIGIIILFVQDMKCVPIILGGGLYMILIWSLLYVKRHNEFEKQIG